MTQPGSSTGNQTAPAARLQDRYLLGLLFFVTAATYLTTLRFGFVYDDKNQIYFNPFIKAWRYVPQYFANSLWRRADPLALGVYYRPLYLVWLRFNYAMFSIRPMGWHLSEVLLHLLVTWLVYRTIKTMTGQFTPAWVTALIFSVHPIHHEVVAWISGANESLYAALFLAAFLAYLHFRKSSEAGWMILSCLFYGLALLSKETAIVLPVLIFAYDWIAGVSEAAPTDRSISGRITCSFMQVVYYIPIGSIYLIVRYKAMTGFNDSTPNASFATWLLTLPSVLCFYLKNWFLPFHLSEFYDLPYQTRPNLAHVFLPAVIVFLMVGAVCMVRNRIGSRHVGYAALWILVPLLPALNIFLFKVDDLVHDRYFYVPSIGASLLVALLIERVGQHQPQPVVFGQPLRVVVMALGLTSILAAGTIKAINFWQDDYTLFSRAQQIAPHNPGAVNNLSVEWISRGELEQAQSALEKGLQENREDSRFATNLGRALYLQKQYAKAEEFTRHAMALDPNVAESYVTLGEIQLKQNRPAEAKDSVRRAVELSPFDAHYHTIYGIVLELNGDCPQAMIQFNAAEALVPGDFFTRREMAKCGSTKAPAVTLAPQPVPH